MLDGPRILPRGTPTSLVVLLHGYGADGNDLIGLADEWRDKLPNTAFVSPHAPQTIPGYAGGRQWFPLTLRDPTEYWRGVTAARPALDAFLDAELARLNLQGDRLAIVGFSQGCMMALHVGPRRPVAPAALIGLSGMIAGPQYLAAETRVRPPVLLVHGDADEVIPVAALHITREALASAGFSVEWHERIGLSHGIDMATVNVCGRFLAERLSLNAIHY
jgi:phospholipase/carboxylesterase